MNAVPRGSEWRRWDPHVHTPHSVLNNQFGADFDVYARRLLEAAADRDIAAIGITDYFSIDGYRQIKSLLADGSWLGTLDDRVREHALRTLIFANVELRGFVVTGDERRDSRINFHVLFSEELAADDINDHFLARLEFTAAAAPGRQDERWSLTRQNLAALGARLKAEHPPFQRPDLEVGMMNAVVSHEDVTKILTQQPSRFEGMHLLVAPIDEDLADIRWDSQGHLARKLFIQKSHMLFSANPRTREFALGRRHMTVDAYLAEFQSLKPCIHGSDAHSYEGLFEPPDRRFTWIKADPTWHGLIMLLNEPANRVYVGPQPPELERIADRSAKTIASVEIVRAAGSTTAQRWFDNELQFNPALCAVIGNRGNGKSALAEVIGLLGDTHRADSFSFLSAERFRHPRIGLADQFQGKLTWGDGSVQGPRLLSHNPSPTAVERVKYIGQGYLEEICNEIERGGESRFYRELQDVIFSHVGSAERQGHASLDSLLTYLGEGIRRQIAVLKGEIGDLNRRITELRDRSRPDYRAALVARHAELNRQQAAHDAQRPAAVADPADAAPAGIATPQEAALADLRIQLQAVNDELADLRTEDARQVAARSAASRLLDRVRAIEAAVRGFRDEGAADASAIGVDLDRIVTLGVDTASIDAVIAQADATRVEISRLLDPLEVNSPSSRRSLIAAEITRAEEQLSLPQRRYQEYRAAMARWEEERAALQGLAGVPATIAGVAEEIAALDAVPSALTNLKQRRRRKVLEVYAAKERLRSQYAALHRPVSEFLEASEVAKNEAFKLRFAAEMVVDGLSEALLRMINQRRVGPFFGADEGRARLDGQMRSISWSSCRQAVRFAEVVEELMLRDAGRELQISDQLRQGFQPQDALDLLFSLEYLRPTFKLTWDSKAVSELSPGERGNLLLIFYLLVDRQNVPLVIDQPEENLDNQTIYRTLVPCMRDARLRRQVVVVTHNPNLAVVCDADQVIYAEIVKDGTNEVRYETGAIEDPAINRRIVDVLEGTMPAFDQRAAKYSV